MEETHTSLTPNKERKNVFPNVPVTGFWNCTILKACSTQLKFKDVSRVAKKKKNAFSL